MTDPSDISAIILSAGYSSRMGAFKPLLRFGEQSALERAVHLFKQTGMDDVHVVLGHCSDDLVPVLQRMHVGWTVNEQFAEGMVSSVKAGMSVVPHGKKAVFVLPVDLPLIRRNTVEELVDAFRRCHADVVYPCFLGRRGHPPLISTRLLPGLLGWNGSGGLRSFLQCAEYRAVDIEVVDRFIRRDMDTLEDYCTLCKRFVDYEIPSPAECMVLLVEKCSVSERVMAHSWKVAEVAMKLVRLLRAQGCFLNERLVVAAGLLHDLAKGLPNHGPEAAGLLRTLGFDPVARLVEGHMECSVNEDRPVDELDVLRISDRIVEEDRIVGLEAKFQKRIAQHGGNARSVEAIEERYSQSKKLRAKVEHTMGRCFENVFSFEPEFSRGGSPDNVSTYPWNDRPAR